MITANGVVVIAVTAMKSGADDYLNKPVSLGDWVYWFSGWRLRRAGACGSVVLEQLPEVPATQTTANATVNNDSRHLP